MDYKSEKYQLGIVTDHLQKKGYKIETEVDMYSIPIDIIGVNSDEVISVELKSKDVKKGIGQAKRNLLYVDYSYLTLWSSNISEETINKFEESPMGLISVDDVSTDGELTMESPADKNTPDVYARNKLKKVVNDDI